MSIIIILFIWYAIINLNCHWVLFSFCTIFSVFFLLKIYENILNSNIEYLLCNQLPMRHACLQTNLKGLTLLQRAANVHFQRTLFTWPVGYKLSVHIPLFRLSNKSYFNVKRTCYIAHLNGFTLSCNFETWQRTWRIYWNVYCYVNILLCRQNNIIDTTKIYLKNTYI